MRCELAIKCTKPRTTLAPSSFNSGVIRAADVWSVPFAMRRARVPSSFINVCFAIVSPAIADVAGAYPAAGAGQSQPTENHGDQPQHQGRGATDYSVAAAGTTLGDG